VDADADRCGVSNDAMRSIVKSTKMCFVIIATSVVSCCIFIRCDVFCDMISFPCIWSTMVLFIAFVVSIAVILCLL
jgi:hypothetical protein